MISQLPGNFRVDKLLCEARDVVCLDCAVRRPRALSYRRRYQSTQDSVFASGGSSDLSQAKSQRMQKSQASQSLCHYAVVEPSLLPALCCSRLRVKITSPFTAICTRIEMPATEGYKMIAAAETSAAAIVRIIRLPYSNGKDARNNWRGRRSGLCRAATRHTALRDRGPGDRWRGSVDRWRLGEHQFYEPMLFL